MNRLLLLKSLIFLAIFPAVSQRYISEVFTDYTLTSDVWYANNISVLTGSPSLDSLRMDIYEPTGDTYSERPVILIAHDGEFLPESLNGLPFGNKRDSAIVDLCITLAKRGYVAISFDHRLGWNPTGSTQDVRTGTFINAMYRATQDGNTAIRFIKKHYTEDGNIFGFDTSRIIVGGMGSGGHVSSSISFLDKESELSLPKFLNPATMTSFVDFSLSGNVYGTEVTPLTMANYTNYSSDFHFGFNLGGAVWDSTWVESGDVPFVSFSPIYSPYSPYEFGALIARTTGDFIVNVSGAKGIQRRQEVHNNNLPFESHPYSDALSTYAASINGGLDGLFPLSHSGALSNPWNYWNTTTWNIPHPYGGTFNDQWLLTNPGMSYAQTQAYLDTITGYLCPRIVCALNLPGCEDASISEQESLKFDMYPNPASKVVNIRSEENIDCIEIYTAEGILAKKLTPDSIELQIDISDLSGGVYYIQVKLEATTLQRKLLVSNTK